MAGGTPPPRGVTAALRRRVGTGVARDERGAVLVMVLLWLPVLILMAAFVIDVANWFVHKRHLQMQADAAALAAARDWSGVGCSDAVINARAAEYGGGTYNAQIGGTNPSQVHMLINSSTYYNQSTPVDGTVNTAPPCAAAMVDVKMTETNLPWYFKVAQVPFINAHARVSVLQADSLSGALPVGVPDANPLKVGVKFVDETTGQVLGERELTNVSGSGGNAIWDNSANPLNLSIDRSRIGVRVALSYGNSLDCSNALVTCYDAGSANTGVMSIRGWQAGTVLTTDNPVARDVKVLNGDCTSSYFTATTATCHVGIDANIDFGTLTPVATVGAKVEATVGGTNQRFTLTYNSTTHRWVSATTIPIAPGAGSVPINLNWEKTIGTSGGATCSNKGSNPCQGTFTAVQRVFAGNDAHSGPIMDAHLFEAALPGVDANSLQSCASGCNHNLVVELKLVGNLKNASSASDPPVALRVIGGSQNQSLDCDPAKSNLKDELATGCGPSYTKNGGTACPAGNSTLWATAQPWPCVGIQTGGATNQVPAGMNTRVLGADKPASCTSPNNWSSFPNLSPADPRIVQVFLTPFGSFDGSGNTTLPVIGFATFYATGWSSQGSGFANPCAGQGDDPVPNNDGGYIMGHFINYIPTLSPGTGTQPCNPGVFGTCVISMTE